MLKHFFVITVLLCALALTACGGGQDGPAAGIAPDIPGDWQMSFEATKTLLENQGLKVVTGDSAGRRTLQTDSGLPQIMYIYENERLLMVNYRNTFPAADFTANSQKAEAALTADFKQPEILSQKVTGKGFLKLYKDGDRYAEVHAFELDVQTGSISALYYDAKTGAEVWKARAGDSGFTKQ